VTNQEIFKAIKKLKKWEGQWSAPGTKLNVESWADNPYRLS
jgi:hypothetical protein